MGLADDAAVLEIPPGRRLVATMDTLVAGVHFPVDEPPEVLAGRVLGVNLSDLAAMGATPFVYLLSVALPATLAPTWRERLACALGVEQERHGITLAGGDTVSTPGSVTLTVTALGTVAPGQALRRAGAVPGETVFVSGTIGDGALGLLVAQGGLPHLSPAHKDHLLDRYRRPRPRLALGARLFGLAGAAMDISDGLVADLGHICRASGVAAVIEAPRIPLSEAARSALDTDDRLWSTVLGGGDDYELLFTATDMDRVAALARDLALPLTAIGHVTATVDDGSTVVVVDDQGADATPTRPGYRHF